ncbi:hypothetical protein C8R46DRAFT_1190586 [Mycena filopes]|nr:hypothetical protein C8R46DRAFT_1190586 [Mycena filopes]
MAEPLAVPRMLRRTTKDMPRRRQFNRVPICAGPRRCLFAMCTHTLPQLDCILDPVEPIVLKTPQIYICTPYRYVPQVPQEIIDHIVDNIEDMDSFKACSLVCWAFVPASRTHIFREVAVDMLRGAPRKLHTMLLRSPQIILYIKDLTIYRTTGPEWGEPDSPLPAVISMLSHVKRLSIFGCWGDWRDQSPAQAAALQRVISSGRLERLHILTCSKVPIAVLQSALSIPVLSLLHVGVDSQDDPRILQLPRDASAASPETLSLSASTDIAQILEHIRAPNSTYLSKVRRVALNPLTNASKNPQVIAGVLSAVETTLERFDLQVHQFHFKAFDTSRLTHLRTVQLSIIMDELYTLIPDFLPRTLTRLRIANPLLEHLVLIMHLPAPSPSPSTPGAPSANVVAPTPLPTPAALAATASRTAADLAVMDAEFGGASDGHGDDDGGVGVGFGAGDSEGFPALKSVHWRVVVEAAPPMLVPDYAAFLAAHLPRARARGVLSVEQTTRKLETAIMPHLPGLNLWPHRPKNPPATAAR